jgi:hypothetical protein
MNDLPALRTGRHARSTPQPPRMYTHVNGPPKTPPRYTEYPTHRISHRSTSHTIEQHTTTHIPEQPDTVYHTSQIPHRNHTARPPWDLIAFAPLLSILFTVFLIQHFTSETETSPNTPANPNTSPTTTSHIKQTTPHNVYTRKHKIP